MFFTPADFDKPETASGIGVDLICDSDSRVIRRPPQNYAHTTRRPRTASLAKIAEADDRIVRAATTLLLQESGVYEENDVIFADISGFFTKNINLTFAFLCVVKQINT